MVSEPAPARLLAGRYRLGEHLAAGGMGHVYLARDEALDRNVAVKLLPHHQSSDTRAVERFDRETAAAASLSHPNVIRTLDRGVDEHGTPFLVMEYVPGPTLKELVRAEGPL